MWIFPKRNIWVSYQDMYLMHMHLVDNLNKKDFYFSLKDIFFAYVKNFCYLFVGLVSQDKSYFIDELLRSLVDSPYRMMPIRIFVHPSICNNFPRNWLIKCFPAKSKKCSGTDFWHWCSKNTQKQISKFFSLA